MPEPEPQARTGAEPEPQRSSTPPDLPKSADVLWKECCERLATDKPDAVQSPVRRQWLDETTADLLTDTGDLRLIAPHTFAKDWLENDLRHVVGQILEIVAGTPVTVRVTTAARGDLDAVAVSTSQAADLDQGGPSTTVADARNPSMGDDLRAAGSAPGPGVFGPPGILPRPVPSVGERAAAQPDVDPQTQLNSRYTFDTFVVGSSNRFAWAACVAVAEVPAQSYNPLFIYGEAGLGKTHLLHAVGHYAQSLYPDLTVQYVTSEQFTNEFINAVQTRRMPQFQQRYRQVDLLMIDDIQFLEEKEGTQEEFFHTFNALHNAQKQIVISSDRAPARIAALEDRLRSRFIMGLTTDVQPPDLETRIAILRNKATRESLGVADDVLGYIASRVDSNIRELEGALIRVVAYAYHHSAPQTVVTAEDALRDVFPDGQVPTITPTLIMQEVAAYFDVRSEDLCDRSRTRQFVQARQVAMYLMRELTGLSLPAIGTHFERDHSTVLHACNKIARHMQQRLPIYEHVTDLTARIKRQARG